MNRRALQIVMALVGAVAIVAGGLAVVAGVSIVPGAEQAHPDVDSEFRFFASWYVIAGALVFRAIPGIESSRATVDAVGAGFFLAGCGRLISMAVVGRPHTQFLVLMVVELVLPFVLIPWQRAVARSSPDPEGLTTIPP